MALTADSLKEVGEAQRQYFEAYNQFTYYTSEIDKIDTAVNSLTYTGDVSGDSLFNASGLAGTKRDEYVGIQNSAQRNIDEATPIILNFFSQYTEATGIYNSERTQEIIIDRTGITLSVIPYGL